MEISRVEMIDGECYVKMNMLENEVKRTHFLKKKIELASKLLEEYMGILDDTADLYFENVLSILKGDINE